MKLLRRVRLPELREFDFNDGQYNAMNPQLGNILKNADWPKLKRLKLPGRLLKQI